MRSFASDNSAPVHPHVMEALQRANRDHALAYGDDPYTPEAEARFRDVFGPKADVFFVFNGTGANIVALRSLLQPYQAAICTTNSHVHVDECGGAGQLIAIECRHAKLTPELVKPQLRAAGNVHHIQPGAISLSQSTEYGTLYDHMEIGALVDLARGNGLKVHVDGARLANAVAASEQKHWNWADAICFGGTKNGLMYGEAIVYPNGAPESARYLRKQSGQLASKMRFIAAQFVAVLEDDLWLHNARHANHMAALLAQGLDKLGIEITQPVQANAVFCKGQRLEPLRRKTPFYVWEPDGHEVRLMTSFDTTEEEVDEFLREAARL